MIKLRINMNSLKRMNLENAVEHCQAYSPRSGRQGQVTYRMRTCYEKPRGMAALGLCHELRSAVTHEVNKLKIEKVNIHGAYRSVFNGQLRF